MKYQTVVGLEVHCELKTNTKVFSTAKNEYNEIPNINVKALDLAFPGTLPNLNFEAVKKAIKMALCLNCEIPNEVLFDRKNYYYPDLPKGYQITQNTKPIGINGKLEIEVDGVFKNIFIHDIHLEEDTASLDHYDEVSLIDYNRSGVPLIEIVTTPCIHSAQTAVSFLENLRNIFKYADISEADTKKGQIRCDVNVSLRDETGKQLTPKVEVKNINSFSNVYDAIIYEVKRQSECLETGKKDELVQETRRFDDSLGITIRMREKVESLDYKYFIDPNIPPYQLEKSFIEEIKNEIPVLPNERKKKYLKLYNFSLKDVSALTKDKDISDYFDECINLGINPNLALNWLLTQILGYLNKYEILIKNFYLKPNMLKTIIDNIENNTISGKQAKEIFFKVLEEEKPPENFISKQNSQISDEFEIKNIIKQVLASNQKQIEEYKNGKTNVFDYFIGQVMKETRGKANPVITKKILEELLND